MENTTVGTPQKADLAKRFIAALIDGVIATVIGFIPVIGQIVGGAYLLVRDGLEFEFMDGRSIGKKVMKLRPVSRDGSKMTIEKSVRRNWPFGFGLLIGLLFLIPVIGWALIPIVAIAAMLLGLFEAFKVVTDPEGIRLGDSMAGTKVIETVE